jgi:hypothetical protein
MLKAALMTLWAFFHRPSKSKAHRELDQFVGFLFDPEWEEYLKKANDAPFFAPLMPMEHREMTDADRRALYDQGVVTQNEMRQVDASPKDVKALLDSGIASVNEARRRAGFSSIFEASHDGFIGLREIVPAIVEEERAAMAPAESVRGCVIKLSHPFVMALVKAVGLEGTPVTKLSLHFETGGFATFDATFLVQESDELDAFVDSLRED